MKPPPVYIGGMETATAPTVLAALKEGAYVHLAAFPQYTGYYDGWVLAHARKDVANRGETIIRKGEPCMVNPDMSERKEGFILAHSPVNHHDVVIRTRDLAVDGATARIIVDATADGHLRVLSPVVETMKS